MTRSKYDLVEILGLVLFAILNEHVAIVVWYRCDVAAVSCLIAPIIISVLQVIVLEGPIGENSASILSMVISRSKVPIDIS